MIDKQEVATLYMNGMSLGEIGKKYGVSRQYIHQEIKKLNIHRDRIYKTDWVYDEEIQGFIKEYRFQDGLKWKEIAVKLGIPLHQFCYFPTELYPLFNNKARRCVICRKVLPLTEFHNFHKGPFGKMSTCKSCNCANQIKYYNIRKAKTVD